MGVVDEADYRGADGGGERLVAGQLPGGLAQVRIGAGVTGEVEVGPPGAEAGDERDEVGTGVRDVSGCPYLMKAGSMGLRGFALSPAQGDRL
jgi:hypothetical protein